MPRKTTIAPSIYRNKRIVVVGFKGRTTSTFPGAHTVRHFRSARDAGNGPQKAVIAAIKGGGVDLVFIFTKFCSHRLSDRVKRACRSHNIPVFIR